MKPISSGYQTLLTIGLITAMLLAALPLRAATNVKLSGVMQALGDVQEFQVSRDGRYAVYLADQDTDGVSELYSVLLGGGPPVRLNPILPFGRAVASFQISPDSRWVVYLADQDLDNVVELYSAPIGGPALAGIKLNGALVAGKNVSSSFQISPDSRRVVYGADQDTDGISELYSVPIGGQASAIKLNKTLVFGGDVVAFQISPDGNWVVYGADQDTDNAREIFRVPIGGPASDGIKLSGALVANRNVVQGLISPDSSRVVYIADQDTDDVYELYSVPIGGQASGIKLNEAMGLNEYVADFQISPDSNWVVYRAVRVTPLINVAELFSVPIVGPVTEVKKLNGTLVAGGNVSSSFEISSDSARVVYLADQEKDNVTELFSVPIGGLAAGIKLNKTLVANGNLNGFRISPDSNWVVYGADQEKDDVTELFSVPIGGPLSAGIKLNKTLMLNGSVEGGLISPDSNRVVYRAGQDTDNMIELYSVPIGGPPKAGIKLNGALVAGGNVSDVTSSFQISPDSGRVLYIADQDKDEVFELYLTSNYFLYLPLLLRQG